MFTWSYNTTNIYVSFSYDTQWKCQRCASARYHPRMRSCNTFGRDCLSVCLSIICPVKLSSVCLPVSLPLCLCYCVRLIVLPTEVVGELEFIYYVCSDSVWCLLFTWQTLMNVVQPMNAATIRSVSIVPVDTRVHVLVAIGPQVPVNHALVSMPQLCF